jgi:hypothetical protein
LRQIVFLLAVLAIVAVYGPPKAGHYDRASRAASDRTPPSGQQTHAPSHPDDAAWQSASRNVTTNGSSYQSGRDHARIDTLAHHRARTFAGHQRGRNLVDAARDRSPQHPIPLLI